jgi:ABC-type nitrate/sulfonate/bicarbonate transport system permease component
VVPKLADSEEIAVRAAIHGRRRRRRLVQWSLGIASVIFVVGVYDAITHLPGSNPAIVPPLHDIAGSAGSLIAAGTLPSAAAASLETVAMGYAIGCSLGILIGSLRGWFRIMGYLLDPIIDSLRPVPALAYIPLVILWVGIGEDARVLVISVAAFLSCVVSVSAGMREVPVVYVEAARTMGASRARVFWTVAIPASVPYIFTGLRVAVGAAWGTLVAAELIAAQNGLGFLLEAGQQFLETSQVMTSLVTIGVLGFLMDAILRVLQGRVARWAPVDSGT